MSPNHSPERETLSALFDGALQGDARRFAARRLAHDSAWQEDCGRWQLIGDAMRHQAPIAAPSDFAARVERAIAAEATAAAVPVVGSTRRPVRLWAGGALAASLAALAVFATRAPSPAPTPVAQPTVADAQLKASPAAIPVAPVATPAAPAAEVSTPAPVVERVAAVEQSPRRAVPRGPRRGNPGVAPAATREPSAVLAASTFTPPDATNPFHVPAADPLTTRPWPRAALPGGGALTASYGSTGAGRSDSPSFYPFEPRTHADTGIEAESP